MLACAIFINSASNPKNSPTNHRSPPPSQHPPKPNCPSQLVCQKRSTGHAPTSRPVPSLFQLKSVLADRAGPAGFEPPERDSAEIFPETQNTRRNAWRVYRVRNRPPRRRLATGPRRAATEIGLPPGGLLRWAAKDPAPAFRWKFAREAARGICGARGVGLMDLSARSFGDRLLTAVLLAYGSDSAGLRAKSY